MKNRIAGGKSRRRIAAGLAAALLVCGMTTTVSASDDSSTSIGKGESEQSATTKLNYAVSPDYTVVIPGSVKLSDKSIGITATKVNAEPGYQVQVKVIEGLTADGEVTLERKNDTAYKIYVPLKLGAATVTTNMAVAAFAEKSMIPITGTGSMTFGTPVDADDSADIKAGEYTGTVKFQVAYTKVNG